MQTDSFSNRLQKALTMNNMTQTELSRKTNLDKSLISNYLKGNYKAKQDNLTIMAEILGVSEPWLMGYDVPINDEHIDQNKTFDELDILFSKHKDILTEEDKEYMKFIIKKRMKEIDKQLGEDD